MSVGFTTAAALAHELIEARDEKRSAVTVGSHNQLSDRELKAILATVQERCGAKAGRPIEPVESKMARHISCDELFQCLADAV